MNALLEVELAVVALEKHEPDERPPVESADDPELSDEQIDKLVVKLAARVKSNGGKSEIAEMVGALASKARPA